MALTGVAAFADRFVDSLSGGDRQRVWLAMLLSQDTKFLLLNEPISALDVAHQMDVLALVRKLSSDRGLYVVLVLHDVNIAARFCDRIIALHSGRLIVDGTPDDLMAPESLKRIYGLDMILLIHPTVRRISTCICSGVRKRGPPLRLDQPNDDVRLRVVVERCSVIRRPPTRLTGSEAIEFERSSQVHAGSQLTLLNGYEPSIRSH